MYAIHFVVTLKQWRNYKFGAPLQRLENTVIGHLLVPAIELHESRKLNRIER